jgi:hypothetical protein
MTYKSQLDHLFTPDQFVFTGDEYYLQPVDRSAFFCINPVSNLDNRQLDNLSNLQNFLIEFDEAELTDQKAAIPLIEQAGINIATAVYSGSKSVHLIFSMAETLQTDYRSAWIALSLEIKQLTGLKADPQCKNANRLSRLAGYTRPDTGKVQELLHVGGYIKNELLHNLILKHDIKSTVKQSMAPLNNSLDVSDFETLLRRQEHGLLNKFLTVDRWASSIGMYDKLFRLTCWAIDATGVPEGVFKEYARRKLYPSLLEAGYPANKLDRPIENAYTYKF